MHLNEWVFIQRVKSKAIADYIFSGKCVIRNCLKEATIASLKLEASQVPLDSWIGIFNHEDKEKGVIDKKERCMHKASQLGNEVMKEVLMFYSRQSFWRRTLSHKVQVHELAKKHRIIHPNAELGLSRGTTFLRSLYGCEVQPKHADFEALSVRRTLKQYEKPCSCIIALQNGTMLHFFYGPEKTEEIVTLNEGDVIIFAGDLLHAGGAWMQAVENYRIFAYWPTDEFLVKWDATLAVGGSQRMEPTQYKVTRQFASKESLLTKTNPISSFFQLESYLKYLYDSGHFYTFDSSLYYEGIAAHIDYKHNNMLPFVYSSADVPVNLGKVTKCPHFPKNDLPTMPNEELHLCVKRCVYCVTKAQQDSRKRKREDQ